MSLFAQTATTGSLSGTVTDPSGAAIATATVEATSLATGLMQRAAVNGNGQYVFPNVVPGEYTIKVSAAGFRNASVVRFRIEVTKSYLQDIKLEVGSVTETIEVTAEARAELQTVDSTIGTVIPGKSLPTLPLFTRTVNELLLAQPGATPTGEITGARNDQSTLTLDGIDVSNNSVGGTGSFMYLGVEGIGEFRVGVANPNASFGRGSGGQVSLLSRSGGNQYHGGVFWYHQNDNLNANSWTNNRTGVRKPELKDNRFGFTFGGPIPLPALKNKTFFFVNYDGRRFPNATTFTRIVPLDNLRLGILSFRDTAGNLNTYNLKTSNACGPNGGLACDPRGLGLSPSIAQMWSFLPKANDLSQGDGLNTGGFVSTVGIPLTFGFFSARVDHQLTQKWHIDANIRYFRQKAFSAGVLDIRGGNVNSILSVPTRQNTETIGATGQLKNNLTLDMRFGRVRNRSAQDVQRPNASASLLNIVGTNTSAGPIALDVGGRGGAQSILSEPFDVDTQLARRQENDNRIYQFNADLNWLKGRHTVQFGFHIRNLPTLHRRDDKVLGSLGALVAQIDSDLGPLVVPNSSAPPTCGAARTTGCLQTADAQQWNRLFAGTTGLVDNVSVLAVRDGSFKPLPFGSLLESNTSGIKAPEFYIQDVFRVNSEWTLNLGLNYGWQTSPKETLGRYTLQQFSNGQNVNSNFFDQYRTAAAAGDILGPKFQFQPINNAGGQSVFNTDWGTLGPRAAVAWNPGKKDGILGRILGDKKTVFRAGYSLVYDRQNTVQSVIIPSLGVGFAQTLNITQPGCAISGAPGPGCVASSTNPVLNNYRVGFDGNIPVPTVPSQSVPVVPAWGLINGAVVTYPEILSFQVDPNMKVGRNHAINFSIQRELKGDMILELSYVGRYAQRLPQGMNIVQSPYNQLDKASGQTFAQAFDAVAIALRANSTPANQPFFENSMPGGTTAIANAARNNFINGNVSNIFLAMDRARLGAGRPAFNNYFAQMAMLRSSTGISNYNAMFVTLRKRFTRGLFYDFNYTWAKSLDQLGRVQNSANVTPNSFDLNAEYGQSEFDIKHVANLVAGYDLPFKTRNRFLNHIVSGWNVTGIFTARSGDALVVTQANPVWGGGAFLATNSAAIPTVNPGTFSTSASSSVGSNNIGTNAGGRGTGLNLFSNPEGIFNSFRRVEISRDTRTGRGMPLRGMPRWNIDNSLAKSFTVYERVKFRVGADFFNVLNKVDFTNPGLDLTNPRAFGVITTQLVPANRSFGSRNIQLSARIDF